MKLKDAIPYSLCTPRNVLLPLYDKVRVNGVHGRDLQGGHTHFLVRLYGSGAEEVG